eukprot:233270-Pelagomonas_calceolata.AAC.2
MNELPAVQSHAHDPTGVSPRDTSWDPTMVWLSSGATVIMLFSQQCVPMICPICFKKGTSSSCEMERHIPSVDASRITNKCYDGLPLMLLTA